VLQPATSKLEASALFFRNSRRVGAEGMAKHPS
jgi:hypothetical protein